MLFKKKRRKNPTVSKIVIGKGNIRRATGYNRLTDNVLYMGADGSNRVIQIESAGASEGKSTICCNLAVSLGQTDKKVLVVDLDFHRPTTHMIFGLGKGNGIGEYMLGKASKEKIVKKTEYKNVDLVTVGDNVHNSSLILSSETFKELMNSFRNEYDYVILDCAPMLMVSDYIHISKVSDGVLFVVASGSTTKNSVVESINELKRNDIKILGTVLSMYEEGNDGYYYGKYRGYYRNNYYTTEEELKKDKK